MPTLFLIDGYAQFFRAYHAIRTPMSSPVTKEPTNMTFGFVGMLLKLLRLAQAEHAAGRGPVYIALALDVSGDRGTFRSRLYPEYKATRPEPPDDLLPQVERCLALLREIGLPVLGAEGFEADDVIATLVARLSGSTPPVSIRMISKDKDLKQLLSGAADQPGSVALFDIHTDTVLDAPRLEAETGITPAQVVDYLALMGDNVDNVPGVAGVGEKTAALLIREHGTLDALLSKADTITGKRGENLRAAASLLPLSRALVTLSRDAPVELDLSAADAAGLHVDRLLPILRELGFNRYQDEVRALLTARGEAAPDAAPGSAPAPGSPAGPAQAGAATRPARADDAESLFASAAPAPVRPALGAYRCIRTPGELERFVAEAAAAPVLAVDTETTGVSPLRAALCGVSLSHTPGQAVYIPVRSPDPSSHLDEAAVIGALRPLLERPRPIKCGHNIKFDMLVLRRAGARLVAGLEDSPGAGSGDALDESPFDSMVASYLIDSSRSSHGLEALSLALLGSGKQPIAELIGSGRNQRTFDTVPLEAATPYAAADADLALRLRGIMLPQLRAMGLSDLFARVEMPLVEVLADLEWNGVLVDPAELDRQRARLLARIDELLARIHRESMDAIGRRFDPDSPRQLAAALFNKPGDDPPGLGITPLKKTKTGQSTDAEVLEKLAQDASINSPIPELILEYRQLTKLVSTYLVALKNEINPDTRRVHTSFSQTVAATGRLASSDPNLQNIPIRTDVGREIRRAFAAPPGMMLVTADYSQIELRLLAHLSRDPALTEAFLRDEDIHAAVAAQIHGVPVERVTRAQRNGAKMVNFGIVYGITSFGLARRLGIPEKEAAAIIDAYKRRFAGITTFLQECVEQARRFGYVETMLKRRRPITDIDANTPSRRALAERTAINSVVQGSAADLIKLAMNDLHRLFGGWGRDPAPGAPAGVRMLLQIHDELVFECPEASAATVRDLVVERMQGAMTLRVPLKADAHVGRDWFEGK